LQSLDQPISTHTNCADKCRACQHKHLRYSESIQQKQEFVCKNLKHLSDKINDIVCPPLYLTENYRNKVCLFADYSEIKGWQFGVFSRKEFVAIHKCPVHHNKVADIITKLCKILPDNTRFPLKYFVQNGKQIVLVLKTNQLPDMDWLKKGVPFFKQHIEGLWLHLNPSVGKRVFSKQKWVLIFGEPKSKDENNMVYGARSFQQLIPDLQRHAHQMIMNYFLCTSDDVCIDLYCGTGVLLQQFSVNAITTIGVELNGDAISCAETNAPSSVIYRGACHQRTQHIIDIVRLNQSDIGSVYLHINPPRTGYGKEMCEWTCEQLQPNKIAYMSCSVGTLRKDLEIFVKYGYIIDSIIPYDFFPRTHHVETLVLMKRL